MLKKIILILAYLLLLGGIIGFSIYFCLRLDKIDLILDEIKHNQAMLPGVAQNPGKPDVVADLGGNGGVAETTQPGEPVQNEQLKQLVPGMVSSGDLMNHNTYITVGSGPTGFSAATAPIFESASVPEVAKLRNGDLLLYFVDASTLTTPGTERMGYSKSTDNGQTWSDKQLITMTGKSNAGAAVDPSVVELADGTLRMYFFGSETTQGDPASVEGDHVVYSAISTDGLSWEVEAGERFAAAKLTDPEVVQIDDRYWVMYYSLGTTTGIATSGDGLEWFESKQTWSGGGIPGAYRDSTGSVHLYGCSPAGLVTAASTDGTTFNNGNEQVFTENVSGVCDPSPVLLDDGSVLLVYKQIDQ